MENHEQYKKVFRQFNANGGAKMSALELQQFVNSSIGRTMSIEDAEAAVKLMDSDNDGLLCLEDFLKIIEGVDDQEKVHNYREAFKMYVSEGSPTVITPESLKAMLSRLGETKSIDECKNMISRFDLNGDGVLCFEEFMVMMSST